MSLFNLVQSRPAEADGLGGIATAEPARRR